MPYSNRPTGKPPEGKFRSRPNTGRSYGRSVGGENTLHQTTCANCGNACEVPFLPRGNKPVYCKNCFKQFGKGENEQRMYPATCGNCGEVCTVPFRPVQGKPVFCKNCFGKNHGGANQSRGDSAGDISGQLASIQAKLDTILRTLNPRKSVPTGAFETSEKKPAWRKALKKRRE